MSSLSPSSTLNASTATPILIHSAKLIFFLVLLPAVLTTASLRFTFQRHEILLVESRLPTKTSRISGAAAPIGIYWSLLPASNGKGGLSYWRQEENANRKKMFGWLPAWPSLSQVTASLVRRDHLNNNGAIQLSYQTQYKTYCFQSSEYTLCPEDPAWDINYGQPPAIALWKVVEGKTSEDPQQDRVQLHIRSFHWFQPYYLKREEKPFQQLLQRPATCLLLALNVGLAFVYWNHRITPNQVALMDGPILQHFQYWRALTGTLAHFEWWHLLFNMMSLHNLGQFLEEHYYGSINFFLYNLALIPLTVLIFLGGNHMVYLARVWLQPVPTSAADSSGNLPLAPTRPTVNAVGYSGVLFAWMVVTSLEQTTSCPIPFLKDICFDTWYITKNIKFNVGPLIQLVVAQVILPRVSFGGHLAGIIAGFLLHWNLLSLEVVQPSVLIPLLTLVQWKHRQFLPIHLHNSTSRSTGTAIPGSPRNYLDIAGVDDDVDEIVGQAKVSTHIGSGIAGHTSGVFGMAHLLSTLLYAMALLFMGSILMMDFGSSLLYAQGLLLSLFYCCYLSYIDHWDDEGEQAQWSPNASQKKQRMLVLWKGFIASCVLVLVLESMTLACWLLVGAAMFSGAGWGLCLLFCRIGIHLLALSIACKHWHDIGGEQEEKGIFVYTLEFCVLQNAKVGGQAVVGAWISGMGCRRSKGIFPLSSSGSGSGIGGRLNGDRDRRSKNLAAAAAAERRARSVHDAELA